MDADPEFTDDEIRALYAELSHGLANHPGFEFSYLPRAAEQILDNYMWCVRNAPEDIPQIYRGMDPATLEGRLKRLSPRGRKETLERVIHLAGGSQNWRG